MSKGHRFIHDLLVIVMAVLSMWAFQSINKSLTMLRDIDRAALERIRVLEIQLAEQNLRLCGVEQEVGTCQ